MAQYGVAWFDFDEASGDIFDKLGWNNYVGTVTGVTRVEGWNGEGSAMSFSGTSGVIFNDKIIPIGEKSFRFKIKKDTAEAPLQAIVSTCYATTSTHGDYISIRGASGTISWQSLNATSAVRFNVESTVNICDGKWHDILCTWDGTINNNGIKLYIDDMTTPHITGKASSVETASATYNLNIGKSGSGSVAHLNGQIDDLQIYNKALPPSNFEQKRLTLKTTDNKNLSVLNNRVKEIPNTIESTLLERGRIIREIDGAVDAQPVDLIFNSTQYEITNNTNAPLGNNKVFSLPINKEFKTITIEDNY